MADEALSDLTASHETVTITPAPGGEIDKKTQDSWSAAWDAIDARESGKEPPAEPKAEPKAEAESEPPKTEVEPESESEAVPSAPGVEEAKIRRIPKVDDESLAPVESVKKVAPADDPMERLELHPNSSEKVRGQFGQLKDGYKRIKAEKKTIENELAVYKKVAPLVQEVVGRELNGDPAEVEKLVNESLSAVRTLKQSGSPETAQELENLRQMQKAVGLGMEERIFRPMNQKYSAVVNKIADGMTRWDPAEINATYRRPMLDKLNPFAKELTLDEWRSKINQTSYDEHTKSVLYGEVLDVYKERDRASDEAADYLSNPGSMQKYQQKQQEAFVQNWANDVKAETEVIFLQERKDLEAILPKSIEGLDPEQRAEAEQHNARFEALNKRFREVTSACAAGGGRQAARLGVYVVEMESYIKTTAAQMEKANEDLKAANAELDKLRKELNIKRRVADSPLRPTAGMGSPKSGTPSDKPKLSASKKPDWTNL